MIKHSYSGFYDGIFPDSRIDKRMDKVINDLIFSGVATVNKAVTDHASKIGFYRTLGNERFTYREILAGSFRKCAQNLDVDHVLCIQDTTEFNFSNIINKLGKTDPDIGPTSKKEVAGLFCHPMLVCSPEGEVIYGLSSTSIYNRKWDQKDKYQRDFKNLPIEQKESFRWIENAHNTRACISQNVNITIIGDRESDIYDEFADLASNNTHLLVRSRINRNIENDSGKLHTELEHQLVAGTIAVDLSANQSREKRRAQLEVRHCSAEISAPKRYRGSIKSFKLYAIEAKEVTPNLPSTQSPIHWRLLTTHPVESLQQALQCIEWYKQRWLIEELFRVMKTKGFQVESSQLGSGAGIKKLIALVLEAALQVMRLKLALDSQRDDKAELIFTNKQLRFLTLLLKTVEGKTDKQKNPYRKNTVAWAAWIIARLGKWTGYKSHGPPGYITMKNGYDTFHVQYEIFEMLYEG